MGFEGTSWSNFQENKRNDKIDFQKEKILIWHVQGGLGKNVAATALISDLKRKYADRKIIMVVSWPEVFLNLRTIDKLYHLGHTPHFYDDFLNNKDVIVFQHEAYNQTAHVQKSKHLIENWCDLMDLEYTTQKPQLIINYAQQQLAQMWIREKPTLILHSNGGPMTGQKYSYNWCRDIPFELTKTIVDNFYKDFHIFHICRPESPKLEKVERLDQPMNNMELFSILATSSKRVLIDSCLQHAAASFNKNSTVLWIGTSPKVFGYNIHNNIVANEPKVANQRLSSYMFDYQFENNLHECPYLSAPEMFNFNQVLEAI